MKTFKHHNFFIPVMGTGFTLDTPIKVARFGIDSVISLVDDVLIEKIRKHYCKIYEEPYSPITVKDEDPRARRITEYLNLLNKIVIRQVAQLKNQSFTNGTDLVKYFELLPETSPVKIEYLTMLENNDPKEKLRLQDKLRKQIWAGSIDVNIMTKLDRDNYVKGKKLGPEFSDALSALRGYANSDFSSGIVFSAGLNMRLYGYAAQFDDFYHQANGHARKRIVLKVSDFRSAIIQGKFFAKKGLWVSEYRIESGLNCGGHVFATDGNLLGPVLEEFKKRKGELIDTLHNMCNKALAIKNRPIFDTPLPVMITVQGGIITAGENEFLLKHYQIDATGWGTPFLLVPEAVSVDAETLNDLLSAGEKEIYMSDVSPLNVPFQNLYTSGSEKAKRDRIEAGRPGSPCCKSFLIFNTEFSDKPVCTASRLYQKKKIEQLKSNGLSPEALEKAIAKVMEKSCICHDLGSSILIKHDAEGSNMALTPAVCPGPGLAYFSKIASLAEMVGHIYSRFDLLAKTDRPNMFMNELKLYIDFLKKKITEALPAVAEKKAKYFRTFYENLQNGIEYYRNLIRDSIQETEQYKEKMTRDLMSLRENLEKIFSDYRLAFCVS